MVTKKKVVKKKVTKRAARKKMRPVIFKFPEQLIQAIDDRVDERVEEGHHTTRSDVVRNIVAKGLKEGWF